MDFFLINGDWGFKKWGIGDLGTGLVTVFSGWPGCLFILAIFLFIN